MKSRTLVILLATLAVLVALAIAVSLSQQPGRATGALLYPGLTEQLNTVDSVVLRTGGNKVVATLERGKAGWTVRERDGYPADLGRLRKNLIALAEATITEEKTSNPEFYDRLRVDDIEKDSAAGLRMDLGSAGKPVASVIIGSTAVAGADSAYARRAGEAQSWLVRGAFDLPRETAGWLDKTITNIPASRIAAVTITHPDGSRLKIDKHRAGEADFRVEGIPAGRELSFPGAGNSIGSALADLSLDGVEPAAGFAPGAVKPTVARFETFDGLVVEVSSWQLPAGNRLRLSARADAALAAAHAPPPGTAPEAGPAADALASAARKDFASVQAEADALNARLGAWVYTVPAYKAEQLSHHLDDLLAPKAGPAAAATRR
ncbi:MAG: hypothetical protein AMXMBFR45_03500 [Gammaproteobacteria bacterium]|nr:DUF4340 domain-containing protein [Gammaproteobacteria bacterium]MDL1880796.1 DUF4340 domain-containing protein [Gammaproteobacteria bacterium PRO2]GIK36058.1 MAG: hypothetical protein BroJett010_26170 [Gammaproteobacteria bacterium]